MIYVYIISYLTVKKILETIEKHNRKIPRFKRTLVLVVSFMNVYGKSREMQCNTDKRFHPCLWKARHSLAWVPWGKKTKPTNRTRARWDRTRVQAPMVLVVLFPDDKDEASWNLCRTDRGAGPGRDSPAKWRAPLGTGFIYPPGLSHRGILVVRDTPQVPTLSLYVL